MNPGGMGKPAGGLRHRPGGGFNTGMGQFGEHLDEAAAQQAAAQKQLTQQQINPQGAQAAAAGSKQASQPPAQQPPREVGSLGDELVSRPLHDIWHEIKQFFVINTWLGINPETEDAEKKQKMTALHRRYQQLDQEQQALARRLYQEREQQKKQQKEEEERKKQAQEQQKQESSLQMPSTPKKGPIGPASGKSRKANAVAQLTQNRQRLSQAQGAN